MEEKSSWTFEQPDCTFQLSRAPSNPPLGGGGSAAEWFQGPETVHRTQHVNALLLHVLAAVPLGDGRLCTAFDEESLVMTAFTAVCTAEDEKPKLAAPATSVVTAHATDPFKHVTDIVGLRNGESNQLFGAGQEFSGVAFVDGSNFHSSIQFAFTPKEVFGEKQFCRILSWIQDK